LDYLEDFEGILFATTNLEESLDSAFERRFLFKICFEKPTAEIRSKIWKAKLNELNTVPAMQLGSRYDLSGGEIENIVRKYKMARVLHPQLNKQEKLVALCRSEKLKPKQKAFHRVLTLN